MIRISKETVIRVHGKLIDTFGGSHGLKDEGALDSAIHAPFQTFDGEPLYPTIYHMAPRLGYGVIQNHPFVDGNKRVGAFLMEAFLSLNGIDLDFTQEELIDIILEVAAGRKGDTDIYYWIKCHESHLE